MKCPFFTIWVSFLTPPQKTEKNIFYESLASVVLGDLCRVLAENARKAHSFSSNTGTSLCIYLFTYVFAFPCLQKKWDACFNCKIWITFFLLLRLTDSQIAQKINNDFSNKLISHELTKAHFVHFSICINHVFAIWYPPESCISLFTPL